MSDHKEHLIDTEKGYEEDVINFRGILYFGLGLFLLIVVTFGLMWVFQYKVLEPRAAEENLQNVNPMARSGDDKLPPEPRLQSAPGFEVKDPKNNRVINLQLREPQAEYRELEKQWKDIWENGEKDEKTGTVIALPIEEAKKKLLESGTLKVKEDEGTKAAMKESTSTVTSASAGRVAP